MKWPIMNLISHKSHPSNHLNHHPPPYRYPHPDHHHHAPSHLHFPFPLPIVGSFLDSLRPGKSMWSPWGRPSPPSSSARRPSFPCSSFKDVPHLYSDPDEPRKDAPLSENHDPNPLPAAPAPAAPKKAVFRRIRVASALLRNWTGPARPRITTPGADARVVVYLTSLRAVRPTSEACRAVQSILTGFRVTVDERDVAMDAGLLEEVQRILGVPRERLKLPAVFVGGWYVGGAEEVRRMNEVGELKRLVESLPEADPLACDACGDFRFVLCAECNGSHKVYGSKADGFRACAACNENGLVKCPSCYPTTLVPP